MSLGSGFGKVFAEFIEKFMDSVFVKLGISKLLSNFLKNNPWFNSHLIIIFSCIIFIIFIFYSHDKISKKSEKKPEIYNSFTSLPNSNSNFSNSILKYSNDTEVLGSDIKDGFLVFWEDGHWYRVVEQSPSTLFFQMGEHVVPKPRYRSQKYIIKFPLN